MAGSHKDSVESLVRSQDFRILTLDSGLFCGFGFFFGLLLLGNRFIAALLGGFLGARDALGRYVHDGASAVQGTVEKCAMTRVRRTLLGNRKTALLKRVMRTAIGRMRARMPHSNYHSLGSIAEKPLIAKGPTTALS